MLVPLHFFLSYSRDDETDVERLLDDLHENGITVWIDKGRLTPGTPNWERSLKHALSHSYGLLLCASPAAADSTFVQAELAYAQSLGIPIIPVWLQGDSWINSVPMSASQTQYVDIRPDNYEGNLSRLLARLKDLETERKPRHILINDPFDSWYEHDSAALGLGYGADSYIAVRLDDAPHDKPKEDRRRNEKAALFDPAAYESLQGLLDELYSSYLSDHFEPLEYGLRWLLQEEESSIRRRNQEKRGIWGIYPNRLILPWEWLGFESPIATSRVRPYWARLPLKHYGLTAGSVWSIKQPDRSDRYNVMPRERAFGIAVNNKSLLTEIFEGDGKQPHPPYNAGFVELVSYGSINAQAFRHLVIAADPWVGRPFAGKVLKETDKFFDPEFMLNGYPGQRQRPKVYD
jgi:hypothetical protein